MKSVSICQAPEDRERARELSRFIDVNFGFEISLEDALINADCDLLAAAERALSANFAIVLLSPSSLPAPLKREAWEPVFVKAPAEYGTPIAFVLLEDCAFPELLRRHRFFDCSQDFLAAWPRARRSHPIRLACIALACDRGSARLCQRSRPGARRCSRARSS
jgi:hypothetical protein